MKQGDIVIINFPFTSLEKSKVRPAVVISNKHFNKGLNVVLLAISTQKSTELYLDPLTQNDLKEGELLKESFIRFSNILSIEKKLIIKKVGALKKNKISRIVERFAEFF